MRKIIASALTSMFIISASAVPVLAEYSGYESYTRGMGEGELYHEASEVSADDETKSEINGLWLAAVELMSDSLEANRRTFTRLDFIKEVFGHIVMEQDGNTVYEFPDVGEYDAPIVAAAVRAGIANGHDDGMFRPDEIITVEQAVAMVIKYLKLRDHALQLPDELLEGLDLPFWITPYLKWAMTYSEELMEHFEIGAPASPELVEVLQDIIRSHNRSQVSDLLPIAEELIDEPQEDPQIFTRIEFIKEVFGSAVLENDEPVEVAFWDVEERDAPVVAAAISAGIADGHGDGTFGPNDIISVEQAVAMVIKYLNLLEHAYALPDELLDGVDVPDWIEPYLKWAKTYSEELASHFEVGLPASPELVEVLKEIIQIHMLPAWLAPE